MKKTFKLVAFFVYIISVIATSAAALNHAFDTSFHFNTVVGGINLAAGIYAAYHYAKNNPIL